MSASPQGDPRRGGVRPLPAGSGRPRLPRRPRRHPLLAQGRAHVAAAAVVSAYIEELAGPWRRPRPAAAP